jgi:hypothetical protein
MPSSQEALRSQEGSEKAVVLINSLPVDDCVEGRLHDPRSWRGVVLRIFWFLTVLLLMCVSAASAIKNLWDPSLPYLNVSRPLLDVLWVSITGGLLLIYVFYICIWRTNSTIIPCIHATWYKIYTVVVILIGFAAFILSAVETRVMKSMLETTSLPEFDCQTVMGSSIYVPVGIGQGNFNV